MLAPPQARQGRPRRTACGHLGLAAKELQKRIQAFSGRKSEANENQRPVSTQAELRIFVLYRAGVFQQQRLLFDLDRNCVRQVVASRFIWHTSELIIWLPSCESGVKRLGEAIFRGNMKL